MDDRKGIAQCLKQIYEKLDGHFGNLNWWPADTPFEVIVGAILTQNTAWINVTYAISKLKEAGALNPHSLYLLPIDTLAILIRSSGYYHVKARRLAAFVKFIHDEYNGSLQDLFFENHWQLRKKLLRIKGIGEETADSILLYAGEKPVFVVDAYTRRILERHGFVGAKAPYAEIQALFMDNLPHSVALYNQYHALLVNTGKKFCTKENRCEACPLRNLAPRA
jgi:endonuclease III related protein